MEPFVERMKAELDELAGRLDKINLFINDNNKFMAIPVNERDLMLIQRDAMSIYYKTLSNRFELHNK